MVGELCWWETWTGPSGSSQMILCLPLALDPLSLYFSSSFPSELVRSRSSLSPLTISAEMWIISMTYRDREGERERKRE